MNIEKSEKAKIESDGEKMPLIDFKKINKIRLKDSLVPSEEDVQKFVRTRRQAKALHTPKSMFIQTHMLNSKQQQ